jgi:hypothetical protein
MSKLDYVIGKSDTLVCFDTNSSAQTIANHLRELTLSAILISSIPDLTKEQTEAIVSGSGEILKNIRNGLNL